MDQLTLTLDAAPTYEVVAVIAPPQPNWLNLPEVHARLLPLAEAGGHAQLLLSAHVGTLENGGCYYEADCAGGPSGFQRYTSFFDHDSTPQRFEASLREKLEKQVQYFTQKGARHAA